MSADNDVGASISGDHSGNVCHMCTNRGSKEIHQIFLDVSRRRGEVPYKALSTKVNITQASLSLAGVASPLPTSTKV